MPRHKLPDEKKKVRLPVTVDHEIAKIARATGNASEWVNNACKKFVEAERKKHRTETKETVQVAS